MRDKLKTICNKYNMSDKEEQLERSYTIRLDSKTVISVKGYQLYKERWLNYFGSIDAVDEFIKNYK